MVLGMIIKDRLALARGYIELLRKLRSRVRSVGDLVEDYLVRGAIERYLHLTLEAIIDAGMRFTAILGLPRLERYQDVARILRDQGVLDDEESRRLELWISLRNILVHGYARLDYEKLYEALSGVEELEHIIEKMHGYVESKSVDPEVAASQELVARVRGVLERYEGIVFAYIFGSHAKGTAREGSDVDVAVYTAKPLGWRDLVKLTLELEDTLGSKVDVVDLRTAPPLLAYEVVSKGVPVLERSREERVEFEVRVLKEYLDLKPRLERYYREHLSR